MKRTIPILILFIFQNYLIVHGGEAFGMLVNPFLLFIVSLVFPVWYLKLLLTDRASAGEKHLDSFKIYRLAGVLLGVLSILIFFKKLHTLFYQFPDPGRGSDIIPQMTTLYERYSKGIFPYYPLEQLSWHPYPVYMPLHWLPLRIVAGSHYDMRWIGVLFLTIACGVWGYCACQRKAILQNAITIILPPIVLWSYLHWDRISIAVSFELIIAAYYLLLATGLASRNIILTAFGIICCLLSRYTMIFWLPLFLVLLWQNASKKQNILTWLSIAASILFIYLIPFYFKDPSILSKGIAYHNSCYVIQWIGFGKPQQFNAFDLGLNFSYFSRALFKGDMETRVLYARMIQAGLMIILVIAGLWIHKKWKGRINYFDLSLVMLYLILLFFFMSNPLTYRYYYLDFLVVSAVLCGKIIRGGDDKSLRTQ